MSNLITKRNDNDTLPTFFSDFFQSDPFFKPGWLEREFGKTVPSANIKESDKDFRIELIAPGFKKEEFNIDFDDEMVTISGEKKEEKTTEKDRFTRKEYSYNSFSRAFDLPKNANLEKMAAKYEDGVLKITLPKQAEAKEKAKKKVVVS
jgi:HSP20 family protein